MIFRLFGIFVGFGFTVIGSIYLISYLNLFSFRYNFNDYVHFICGQIECLYFLIGISIMLLSIYIPGGKKDELCL